MISIEKNGESLDLANVSIPFILSNPVFSDDVIPAARSLPFEIPYTTKNARIFEFPRVISNVVDREVMVPGWTLKLAGIPWLVGSFRVFGVGATIKISFQQTNFLGFADQRLRELNWGGLRTFPTVADMLAHAKTASMGTVDDYDYAFPLALNDRIFEGRNLEISGVDVVHCLINYYDGSAYINSNPIYEGNGSSSLSLTGKHFENTIIPFPYLVYLVKQAMANRNVQAYGSFLDHPDVKKIITWNNNAAAEVSGTTLPPVNQFDVKNHVPDMTVSEFFRAIRDNFSVGFFYDQKGNLELVPNYEILADNTPPVDWRGKIIPPAGIEFDKQPGFTMTAPLIEFDSEAWLQATYGNGEKKVDLRFGTQNSVAIQDPVEIGLGGNDTLSPTLTFNEACNVVGEFFLEQKAMKNFWTFYLGMLPGIPTNPPRDFPATAHDGDDGTTQHTEFKLSVGEANGLYDYWHKDWVDKFLSKTRPFSYLVRLGAYDLLSFTFKRKYQLPEAIAFAKEVQVTVTNRTIEPAEIDFMKI